jgi:SHS2 domain-containing protein
MKIHEGRAAGYETLDHEADTGFIVFGNRYEDLFVTSARAVFSLITDLRKVRQRDIQEVMISGEPDALIIFLNDLLYLWDADRFITKTAQVGRKGNTLRCVLHGEYFDQTRHIIRKEVKAATYHGFSVECKEGLYQARFILDI